MYDVAGFMDKNRDTLRHELSALMKKSDVSFVKHMFGDRPVSENNSSPNMGTSPPPLPSLFHLLPLFLLLPRSPLSLSLDVINN